MDHTPHYMVHRPSSAPRTLLEVELLHVRLAGRSPVRDIAQVEIARAIQGQPIERVQGGIEVGGELAQVASGTVELLDEGEAGIIIHDVDGAGAIDRRAHGTAELAV